MPDSTSILVTGGAGYVGSHVLVALAAAGRRCICVDNHSNSSPEVIGWVERITGQSVPAYRIDVRDADGLRDVLARHSVDGVIHLAGLKAVGESVRFPERYHDNNVRGTATLIGALGTASARHLVFSSSATVYSPASRSPIDEDAECRPQSPYGENKLEIERMFEALAQSHPSWKVANLRYFNPIGAHPSGLIGELPSGRPNNLMPYICQVAAGRLERLDVFGNDYPTPDGTGIRDFLHVMDLAEGHVAALQALERSPDGTVMTVNLGTGRGCSVLELLRTFERVNGLVVPWSFGPRRPGDVAVCYADATRAKRLLGWEARRDIESMCRDAWRWQLGLDGRA